MNVAHLYALPIALWELHNGLLTSTVDAIAQRELEGALHAEWQAQANAATNQALGALMDAEDRDALTMRAVRAWAEVQCRSATPEQLATFAASGDRAAKLMTRLLVALASAAEQELLERDTNAATTTSPALVLAVA